VVEELVGQWDLEEVEDLEVDLEAVTITMEALVNKVLNLETQELTDTETQAVTDNILTTAQAVEELQTVVNQDHQDLEAKAETAETEDLKELQAQQDQAVEAVDLGVEHHLEDQAVEVQDLLILTKETLEETLKAAEAAEAAKVKALLVAVETVS
jgi:hypothetical protein